MNQEMIPAGNTLLDGASPSTAKSVTGSNQSVYDRFYEAACGDRSPEIVRWIERFWSSIDKNPDGCWLWRKCTYSFGYGAVNWRNRALATHRVAFLLEKGPLAVGLCVCHKCDVPACCRPDHLFSGTRLDNNRDMDAKGRDNRLFGENHSRAKLTDAIVIEARRRKKNGDMMNVMAKEYGVDRHALWQAIVGKTWKNIPLEL